MDLAGRPGQASVPCRKTFHGKNMTEPVDLQNDQARSAFAAGAEASLESVLCTEELVGRPSRPPDYQKENGALVSLSNALADSPRTVLQTLADTILDVCRSGSAGVSLLTTDDGGKEFYWPAIAGEWKPHIGGGTPRDFGPCGDVLDRNTLCYSGISPAVTRIPARSASGRRGAPCSFLRRGQGRRNNLGGCP